MSSTSSKEAFVKLDPVIRMLLSSVESYREVCTSSETQSEERILGILRVQVRILENLERAINEVMETYGAGALLVQVNYVLLPLRLILQSSAWNESDDPIRQSAVWKTTEGAARVMECTVKSIGSMMPFKQTLDCLTACTFPLPTEAFSSKGLDRGDTCMCAVLHCIDTLLEHAKEHEKICAAAMGGNLFARLSFSCTILLSPESHKSTPEVRMQALHTLDTLMKVAPVPEKWQSYFPGLFATLCGLVMSELRLAPALASPNVSSSACRTLSRLLSVTLSTVDKEKETPTDVWKQVQQLASNDDGDPSNTNEFLQQVDSRLPAPLILLLNLLPTATSPKLKEAAASDLCHAILVETRAVWSRDESSTVLRTAIESCITLSRDKDKRVVAASKKTLAEYQVVSWGRVVNTSSTIGPRFLELIEELPALARSGREMELRGRINLLSGYLLLGGSLRSSLTSVATEIQTSLAVLFDVDFDSIEYTPRVETTDSWNVWQPDRCRFRFMMDETAKSAREMARLLGGVLGQKGASVFVDNCVADVLEACIASPVAPSGPRQVDWLHEWIGCIVIAKEILVGAFRESQTSTIDDGVPDEMNASAGTQSRQDRRRCRRLQSLAGAILPVIISAPLWTLPTVLDNVNEKTVKDMDRNETLTLTEINHESEIVRNVSASALKGNAAMVCSLIGLLSETISMLPNEVNAFLPIVLYPLCKKASSQNHSQVQRTAAFALRVVAEACGLSSTKDLIRQNFDYLFGAMLSQTRRPGGLQAPQRINFPTDMPSIVQVVLRCATDDNDTTTTRCSRSMTDETCVSYMIDLVCALVASFDANLVILNNDLPLQASVSLDMVRVFDAALSFIASTFGLSLDKESNLVTDVPIPETGVDWKATLEPFLLVEADGLTSKEGFEKIYSEHARSDGDQSIDEATTTDSHPPINITDGELHFVSLALARCSFFLSSLSLSVEVASCATMQHAFELLGHVAKYTKEDESNGANTAVLRYINTSWPLIISRLRALSTQVISAASVKTISIRSLRINASPTITDQSTQMIFLSKLFELIASMCEVSQDFLVGRIRDEVWPITAELLDLFVQQEKIASHRKLSSNSLVLKDAPRKKAFVSEREKLLLSVLDFLSRIYVERKCGVRLSGLIPTVGTIILPFLANEGELQGRTLRALKQMMLIDCDALWRPLLQLSHRPLPPQPFGTQAVTVDAEDVRKCMTPFELAAEELVDFIEALPEQPLDIVV